VQEQGSTVQLYNAHDPYLTVARLTNGTMVLANENVSEVAFGLVTLLMGLILCIPLCMTLVVDVIDKRSKEREGRAREQAKQEQDHQVEVALSHLSLPAM
jgi:hypothetical protein